MAEGCFSFYKVHNGERLLEGAYHWGQSLDGDGYRVDVGRFAPGGFFVGGLCPDDFRDALGVVVSRN